METGGGDDFLSAVSFSRCVFVCECTCQGWCLCRSNTIIYLAHCTRLLRHFFTSNASSALSPKLIARRCHTETQQTHGRHVSYIHPTCKSIIHFKSIGALKSLFNNALKDHKVTRRTVSLPKPWTWHLYYKIVFIIWCRQQKRHNQTYNLEKHLHLFNRFLHLSNSAFVLWIFFGIKPMTSVLLMQCNTNWAA